MYFGNPGFGCGSGFGGGFGWPGGYYPGVSPCGRGAGYALILVLFILLVIIGASRF